MPAKSSRGAQSIMLKVGSMFPFGSRSRGLEPSRAIGGLALALAQIGPDQVLEGAPSRPCRARERHQLSEVLLVRADAQELRVRAPFLFEIGRRRGVVVAERSSCPARDLLIAPEGRSRGPPTA